MKSMFFILTIISFLFCCTHNHVIKLDEQSEYSTINKLAAENQTEIFLSDGQKLKVENFEFVSDSISWTEPGNKEARAFHLKEVSKIQLKKRIKGTLEGLGIGLLSAAIITVVSYLKDYPSENRAQFDANEKTARLATVLGILGGSVGASIGYIKGSKEVYYYKPKSSQIVPNQKRSSTTDKK